MSESISTASNSLSAVAIDPWTVYWQSDNLDSCIASGPAGDSEAIARLWQNFAADLDAGASVLDLATGNGTVPFALLQGNDSLRITGVDKAGIDPLHFLSTPGPLAAVDFVGATDICALPFEPENFDAVTSQFGIEYAPFPEAICSAISVLKTGGRLKTLMHHAGSDIVKPARKKLLEMASLLQSGGLVELLTAFVRGEANADALDAAGRSHLESGAGRSSQISGQVFEGVRRVIQSWPDNKQVAAELATVMSTRLRADYDRLSQLTDSALTEKQVRLFGECVEGAAVEIDTLDRYVINLGTTDEALIGWALSGTKR